MYLPELQMDLMPPNPSLPHPHDDLPALIHSEYQRLTQYAVRRKQLLAEKQSKGALVAGFTARDGKVREWDPRECIMECISITHAYDTCMCIINASQLPRSRIKMDAKLVSLLARQQALQQAVESEQQELMAMNEKLLRKAQREAGKVKFDIIKVRGCVVAVVWC